MSAQILSFLFPSAEVIDGEFKKRPYSSYSVEELQEMSIFERVMANNWKLETVCITSIVVMAIFILIGDMYNQKLVKSFLNGLEDVFKKNFYQYGVSETELYKKDSSEDFASYATGRINISQVRINFKLKPRQNVFVWFIETVMSYFTEGIQTPTDRVDIVITPSSDAQYDNFIAAIVSKIGMSDYRKFNYYLSLTRTSDSAKLPESFVFMSETNEFHDKIFTEQLKKSLSLEMASFLRYISFTDQPVERPENLKDLIPRKSIIVSTHLITNDAHLQQIEKVLEAVFSLVDKLAAKDITFSNESLKKVVKTRENEVSKIEKIQDEIKQEQLADEKAKVRRQEKEKLRSLSREEQIKLEKKAMEKKQKKQMKKQRVRM